MIDDQVGYKLKENLFKAEQLSHSHMPELEVFCKVPGQVICERSNENDKLIINVPFWRKVWLKSSNIHIYVQQYRRKTKVKLHQR